MKQSAMKKPRNEFRTVTLEEDGVSHINVGSDARTELGKKLVMTANLGFRHPYLGPFRNHEGYRRYVIHPNPTDNLRYTYGAKTDNPDRMDDRINRQHYRRLVIDGYYLKIKQNRNLLALFKENTLPFEEYYANTISGIIINHSTAAWHTEALNELRLVFQEDRPYTLVTFDEYKILRD